MALAGSVVAFSVWHSAGGAIDDLLLQAALLAVLVVSNAATEVLRLQLSQPHGNNKSVDPGLVILVNSVVATIAFLLWGLAEAGPAGVATALNLDRPWLSGGAIVVGASSFLSQYAKTLAVVNGLKAEKAARLGLLFAAAANVMKTLIFAATLYVLPGSVFVPWKDQAPIWLDAARQPEVLVSLAVAWLTIAGIVRRK
jgi:hypothetical protein